MESFDSHVLFKRNIGQTGQLLLKELFFDNEFTRVLEELAFCISGHTSLLPNDFGRVVINLDGLLEGSIKGYKFLFLLILSAFDEGLSQAFFLFYFNTNCYIKHRVDWAEDTRHRREIKEDTTIVKINDT